MSHEHIEKLEKKISALSDALAHLGRGTSLRDLLHIIKNPGWTTPAEFAFAETILESMQLHIKLMENLQNDLVSASKLVGKR